MNTEIGNVEGLYNNYLAYYFDTYGNVNRALKYKTFATRINRGDTITFKGREYESNETFLKWLRDIPKLIGDKINQDTAMYAAHC